MEFRQATYFGKLNNVLYYKDRNGIFYNGDGEVVNLDPDTIEKIDKTVVEKIEIIDHISVE